MRERLNAIWNRLGGQLRARSPREQLLLAATGFVVVTLLLQSLVVGPLQRKLEAQRSETEQARRNFDQVRVLAPELQRLRGELSRVEARVEPGAQTNLLQLLGQLAQQSEVKVEAIRQKVGARNDRYPETRAEVELRGATLAQTVKFLYAIESASTYLIVRSLSIRARGDEAQTLDVTFSVSSFQRA